jgi:hypothetical protein
MMQYVALGMIGYGAFKVLNYYQVKQLHETSGEQLEDKLRKEKIAKLDGDARAIKKNHHKGHKTKVQRAPVTIVDMDPGPTGTQEATTMQSVTEDPKIEHVVVEAASNAAASIVLTSAAVRAIGSARAGPIALGASLAGLAADTTKELTGLKDSPVGDVLRDTSNVINTTTVTIDDAIDNVTGINQLDEGFGKDILKGVAHAGPDTAAAVINAPAQVGALVSDFVGEEVIDPVQSVFEDPAMFSDFNAFVTQTPKRELPCVPWYRADLVTTFQGRYC